jgi:CelD/BcsL family acetyltransferase involved in cellulose biosynthesis
MGLSRVFELMPLQFTLGPADETSLQPLWSDLESRADASFFLSWDWLGTWLAESGVRPLVLTGRSSEKPVLCGLLVPCKRSSPMLWSTHGLGLHTTGEPTQDVITIEYNGFLVDREWVGKAEPEALAFLTRGMTVSGQRRDEVHLKGVTSEYECFLPSSTLAHIASRKPSWRIDLASVRASGRPYLEHISANTRQQIRRAIRLYEKHGKLAAKWAADDVEAGRFLEGFKALHQRYWTSRGEPGGFAYPFFEGFVRRLAQCCIPRGTIEMVEVSCGSEPIGYVCNFLHKGHVYAYQTGLRYDPDPKLKPGLVSHYLCIEHHLQRGAHTYDFMAGDARYKASLGEPGPEMLHLIVQRPTITLRTELALRRTKHKLDHLRQKAQPLLERRRVGLRLQ